MLIGTLSKSIFDAFYGSCGRKVSTKQKVPYNVVLHCRFESSATMDSISEKQILPFSSMNNEHLVSRPTVDDEASKDLSDEDALRAKCYSVSTDRIDFNLGK